MRSSWNGIGKEIQFETLHGKRNAKDQVKKLGLHLTTVTDFYSSSKRALEIAVFGKNPDLETPVAILTDERKRLKESIKLGRNVESQLQKLSFLFNFCLTYTANYLTYTVETLDIRIRMVKAKLEGMHRETQSSTDIRLRPIGLEKQPNQKAGDVSWLKAKRIFVGSLLGLYTISSPLIDASKAYSDLRAEGFFSFSQNDMPGTRLTEGFANPGLRLPPKSPGEIASDLRDTATDFMKKIGNGPPEPVAMWTIKVPMTSTPAGNTMRSAFGLPKQKFELNLAHWGILYV